MYPIKGHSITQNYQSFHANTFKDVQENPFFSSIGQIVEVRGETWSLEGGQRPGQAPHPPVGLYRSHGYITARTTQPGQGRAGQGRAGQGIEIKITVSTIHDWY